LRDHILAEVAVRYRAVRRMHADEKVSLLPNGVISGRMWRRAKKRDRRTRALRFGEGLGKKLYCLCVRSDEPNASPVYE